MAAFVVLALPRSRTQWLSGFLSWDSWVCGHDELQYAQTLDDVTAWFTQPNIGTVETAAAPFWRLLVREQPSARIAVVRRPVADVMASLARHGIADDTVETLIKACDRKLDQIEHRVPGVLSVRFDDLAREDVCGSLFEHCLGDRLDPPWWRMWNDRIVPDNLAAQVRYCRAYLPRMLKLARSARQRSLSVMARPLVAPAGFTIAEEGFDAWFADATPLMREHMVVTGQDVDDYKSKNIPMLRKLASAGAMQIMTARSNGRMFGYLMTIMGPSLDAEDRVEALHLPFFVSKDCAGVGLGIKLQRAALNQLRAKGVTDVFARAGNRGSGPRLGVMYRRLGYEEFSTLHRLDLTVEA